MQSTGRRTSKPGAGYSKPIKPARLRTACTECHLAKLKCSGESDGCARCAKLGLRCQYEISMVGRASPKQRPPRPKQRAGTARIPSSLSSTSYTWAQGFADLPQVDDSFDWVNQSMANALNPSNHSIDASGTNSMPLSLFQLSASVAPSDAESMAVGGSAANEETGFNFGHQNSNSYTNQQQLESQNIAHGNLVLPSAPASEDLMRAGFHVTIAVPEYYRDEAAVAPYPHATALMNMIDELETCVQLASAPIDQILSMNRGVLSRLPSIIDMDGFKVCHSCPTLLTTVMDLVVALYDMVVSTIHSPANTTADMEYIESSGGNSTLPSGNDALDTTAPSTTTIFPPPDSNGSGSQALPAFSFGCLELEAEEQAMFRNQILQLDLNKCVKVIQACAQVAKRKFELATISGGKERSHSGMKGDYSHKTQELQKQWYSDVERRTNTLLEVLRASVAGTRL
ncbi:hypothetical protein VHEMI01382 [[Torrubiella] hemipterigena]|uniref:Zn(2)-C6 fungal-type domain-containing protein n=1 Tax=[Torrubiella] hemipterigena TaxID=1531966 RepID=A0A0A1T4M1_9HYPO|nr:hypothetical protein VHEMI01382 [[Torrubiella] hemipterigena]